MKNEFIILTHAITGASGYNWHDLAAHNYGCDKRTIRLALHHGPSTRLLERCRNLYNLCDPHKWTRTTTMRDRGVRVVHGHYPRFFVREVSGDVEWYWLDPQPADETLSREALGYLRGANLPAPPPVPSTAPSAPTEFMARALYLAGTDERGWQSKAARLLGIHPSRMSVLLRRPPGHRLRARIRLLCEVAPTPRKEWLMVARYVLHTRKPVFLAHEGETLWLDPQPADANMWASRAQRVLDGAVNDC